MFLCHPYIFFAEVLVQSLTQFFVGLFVFFLSEYILDTSQKTVPLGISSFISLSCRTTKTKLSCSKKSVIILKEVLFDCDTNVGTGATKEGCKTFPEGSGLFGCCRDADVWLNLPNCSLRLR